MPRGTTSPSPRNMSAASPKSGGLLSQAEIDACLCDRTEVPAWGLRAAGWDPARSGDQSALVEVIRDRHGTVWVVSCRGLRGQRWEDQIEAVREVARSGVEVLADATGLGGPVVELAGAGVAGRVFTSAVRDRILGRVVQMVSRRQIRIPRDLDALVRELAGVRREVTALGHVRLRLPRREAGHGDHVVGLGLALDRLGGPGSLGAAPQGLRPEPPSWRLPSLAPARDFSGF